VGGAIHDEPGDRGLAMSLLVCDGMPGRPTAAGRDVTFTCPQWRETFASEVRAFAPQVTVLGIGSWLGLSRRIGTAVYAPGSRELATAYRERLEVMRGVLTRGGRPLVLVAPSCGLPQATPLQTRSWADNLWRSFAAAHPRSVTYADPGPAGCPPPEGATAQLRTPAGALTPAGATAMWRWLASVASKQVGQA
jgi:hypothetical protein